MPKTGRKEVPHPPAYIYIYGLQGLTCKHLSAPSLI